MQRPPIVNYQDVAPPKVVRLRHDGRNTGSDCLKDDATPRIEDVRFVRGLGRYTFRSAAALDFPAIMGITLVVSVSYLIVNLLVDVSYAALDPRVRR